MTDNQTFTYVLVHGSWHDGSAWESVAKLLESAGHIVHTPTLAGHGESQTAA
jgi:alpha-beta hydrolase superfamily lysophospholipase